MPDSFDDRFSGLPVDAPSTPVVSDIVGNAQIASPQFNLVPVDYDPFPKRRKGPAAWNDEPPSEMIRPEAPVADKAFGLNGKERYQFFPERLARSVYDIMSGQVAPYNPSTGEYNVEGAMDMAGLLGGAPLGIKPGMASLGSGAVRPIMNANKNEAVPAFFSAVEKAVTDIQQPKMTGQQWLGTLSNKPGVKPEELDWIGLKDYLKENADKVVTKQEIESHVAANKVELKDVDKGKSQAFDVHYKDTLPNRLQQMPRSVLDEINTVEDVVLARRLNPNFRETVKGKTDQEVVDLIKQAKEVPNLDSVTKSYDTRQQAEEAIKQAAAENHLDIKPIDIHNETKYQSYQLPGGENYREKLLTIPTANDKYIQAVDAMKVKYGDKPLNQMPMTDAEKAYIDKQINAYGENGGTYKFSHWDEPNVLAHVRMNDRTMPTDTFYKVEGLPDKEFATRQEAYQARDDAGLAGKSNVIEANKKKSLHIEEIQSDWHQQGRQQGYKPTIRNGKVMPQGERNWKIQWDDGSFSGGYGNEGQALQALLDRQSIQGVPDAPFKKTWHELALKRMLREAAEKGYDRLSWTPGEAQAARYDLSKQIQQISFHTDEPGKGTLLAYDHKGHTVINKDIINAEKELPDIIGKEATQKLLEQKREEKLGTQRKEQSLRGLELKVGGEGMKGFYDQIIPKALEKIGKEHGVKVKQGKVKINDQGFLSGSDIMDSLGIPEHKQSAYWNNLTQKERDKLFEQHRSRSEPIHYIDIPQSLKDQAMHKGFPLFSGGFMLNPIDHNPFEEKK